MSNYPGKDAPPSASLLERHAASLLRRIEDRCRYMDGETRRAARQTDEADARRKPEIGAPEAAGPVSLKSLARYVRQWKSLLPPDAALRAALIHRLAEAYPLSAGQYPRLLDALGMEEPLVRDAYRLTYAQPIETIFALRSGVHEAAQAAAENRPLESEARAIASEQASNLESAVLSETVVQDEEALRDIEAALEWVRLPGGEALYRQGDPPDSLYILVSGRLRKTLPQPDGSETALTELCRGEMVGEVSLLTGAARATNVYALRDSELLKLDRADLARLAEKYPQLILRLTRLLAQRLRLQTLGTRRQANTLATFTLLPMQTRPEAYAGFLDFGRDFAAALGQQGAVLYLTSQQIDALFGQDQAQANLDDPDYGWLSAWLNEQEAHYRYILYVADPGLTPWTRRCIRQADRLLLVSPAQADPRPGEIEAELARLSAQAARELVLLHPADTRRPSDTHRWLAPGRFDSHHHVRLGEIGHLRRLARRLTGGALGLALGGGGARGLAHIGVLQALAEAGLDIDLVGGTSMGSLVGALFALGFDHSQMLRLARRFSSPFKLYDLTLPLVSFFKSEKVTRVMQDVFEDARIEDLWAPYFCISTNLTRAAPMIHRQGPLWQAVRASSAIPGVFSPVLYEDDLLVDGAVLNNLPIDVMRDLSEGGPIVAVNVMPEVDLVKSYQFGASVSGWEVLRNKLNPFSNDFQAPLLFENLLRVISLNDVHQVRSKLDLADLYIRPDVARFSLLDFRSYRPIIDIGYQQARQDVRAWQAARLNPPVGPALPPSALTVALSAALDRLEALLA